MSQTNFKRPVSIHPQERRDERAVKIMASAILNQAMLDKLLEGANPELYAAMMEQLLPHLSFVPADQVTADCPSCGLKRGSVIAHECLGAN